MPEGDIIFFGRMEWGFSTHLWHHLAREFAKDRKVYYVDPLYVTTGQHSLDISKDTKEGSVVSIIRYGDSFLDKLPILRGTKAGRRVRRLSHQLEELGRSKSVLFFYNPWDAHDYRELIRNHTVIYYATDNAKELFQGAVRMEYIKRENWLCERADLVLGLSRVLAESLAQDHPGKTFYISEGVDPALFRSEGVRSDAERETPRACFVGTLDDSLDWELFELAAATLSRVEFVMVGPVKVEGLEKRFERFGNVRFLGYQKHEFLGRIISASDLCLLIYRNTEFNRMRNPIKLLEYFAAGRVVVSTDFPAAHEYPGLVMIGHDGEEFMEKIRMAITEKMSRRLCDKLLETAGRNTWTQRKVEIEMLIDDIKKRRQCESC